MPGLMDRAAGRRLVGAPTFPLVDPRPQRVGRRGIIVVAGPTARRAVAQRHLAGFQWLTDESSSSDWTSAVESALHLGDPETIACGSPSLHILVLGRCEELAGCWRSVQAALERVRRDDPVVAIVLEWGRRARGMAPLHNNDEPDQPDNQNPLGGRVIRFRLASQYAGGRLSESSSLDVVRRLLRDDLVGSLFEFASSDADISGAELGAAFAWLPEISIERAVSRHLATQVARVIRRAGRPADLTLRPLVSPVLLQMLARQARAILEPRHAEAVRRLPADCRASSCPLLSEDPNDWSGMAELATAWAQDQFRSFAGQVQAILSAPMKLQDGLLAVNGTQVVLAQHAGTLDRALREAVANEQQSARQAAEQDAGRLAAGRSSFLRRGIGTWIATQRLRRTLRQLLACRRRRLVILCQREAVGQLSRSIGNLLQRLQTLLDQAKDCHDDLRDALVPPHPSLLPLFEPDTLSALVSVLAGSLHRILDVSGAEETWRRAIPQIVGEAKPTDDPWTIVSCAAQDVASRLDMAAQPLGRLCGNMLPELSAEYVQFGLRAAARSMRSTGDCYCESTGSWEPGDPSLPAVLDFVESRELTQ